MVSDRDGKGLRIRVLAFEDLRSDASNSDGKILFDEVCALQDFVGAVVRGAREVLDRHGEDG